MVYTRGDLVIITEKENPNNYMFGMVFNMYNDGISVLALDRGTFNENHFKKYKKLGIKYNKYIRFNKYNIYITGKAAHYYSIDQTNRTLDRKFKHITYTIITEYHEYVTTYLNKDNKETLAAYVVINKKKSNNPNILTSGGLFIAPAEGYINQENIIINRARARAEVNMYKQFSCED